MNEIEFDIKDLDNEIQQEIAGCINEGDGFWYCLNEGYMDPEKILADKNQLNKLYNKSKKLSIDLVQKNRKGKQK